MACMHTGAPVTKKSENTGPETVVKKKWLEAVMVERSRLHQ